MPVYVPKPIVTIDLEEIYRIVKPENVILIGINPDGEVQEIATEKPLTRGQLERLAILLGYELEEVSV